MLLTLLMLLLLTPLMLLLLLLTPLDDVGAAVSLERLWYCWNSGDQEGAPDGCTGAYYPVTLLDRGNRS